MKVTKAEFLWYSLKLLSELLSV